MPIEDQQHVALPRLYGASATGRPAPVAKEAPRPFNPDEMPIAADLTDDERDLVEQLPPEAFMPGGGYFPGSDQGARGQREPRRRLPWFVRALTGRLFGSS